MRRLHRGPMYWVMLLTLSVAMLATALYYQYVLDYAPCVLCIHVRMLLGVVALVCVVMLVTHRCRFLRAGGHVLTAATIVFLAERSWQLLATERGWTFGSCDMRSGLPDWLALEDWMPWLFQIHEPCGYTPELPLGITMAEALVGISFFLSAVAVVLSGLALFDLRRRDA